MKCIIHLINEGWVVGFFLRLFVHEFFLQLNADVWCFREQSYSIEKLEPNFHDLETPSSDFSYLYLANALSPTFIFFSYMLVLLDLV